MLNVRVVSSLSPSNMRGLQLSNTYFLIHFFIIQLLFNWARGEPIEGENVRDASQDEFPFIVALTKVDNELEFRPVVFRQFCTGSLITKKHVLTAEHCLLRKKVEEVEILVGSTNLDLCKSYDPKKWTTWQEWKYNNSTRFPPHHHDVAVITLKNCVSEANVIPAVLSKSSPNRLAGKKVKMAGWGWLSHKAKPKDLKTSELTILSRTDCESKLSEASKSNVFIVSWHICAKSEPWALSGCGDSGGPLVNNKKKVVGVTLGICPDVVLQEYPDQTANELMEKRLNLFASLNYYQDFLSHFKNENFHCNVMK